MPRILVRQKCSAQPRTLWSGTRPCPPQRRCWWLFIFSLRWKRRVERDRQFLVNLLEFHQSASSLNHNKSKNKHSLTSSWKISKDQLNLIFNFRNFKINQLHFSYIITWCFSYSKIYLSWYHMVFDYNYLDAIFSCCLCTALQRMFKSISMWMKLSLWATLSQVWCQPSQCVLCCKVSNSSDMTTIRTSKGECNELNTAALCLDLMWSNCVSVVCLYCL